MRIVSFVLVLAVAPLASGCQNGGGGAAVPPSAPDAEPPFFVGRWAAEDAMCPTAAWTFTATSLSTPGEVSCTFDRVTRTTTGYDVEATCTAEGPPAPQRISLSYAQSARALLVEGGPFAPAGLVACN
jgi:hypothetical protein